MRKLHTTDRWRQAYSLIGVNGWCVDEQLQFVESAMNNEVRNSLSRRDVFAEACAANNATGYGPIESEFLYAFIREHRPARIIQVGSGISTYVCLAAANDAAYEAQITCIDPYPTDFLVESETASKIELVARPVEDLEIEFFESISTGDFFFVDSTYTLGPAGEVTRIILEILPRLLPGVFIHFHDIWFPYDFDPRIMDRIFFWHETPLLHAFLCGNDRFLFALRYRCCTTSANPRCADYFRDTIQCRWRAACALVTAIFRIRSTWK